MCIRDRGYCRPCTRWRSYRLRLLTHHLAGAAGAALAPVLRRPVDVHQLFASLGLETLPDEGPGALDLFLVGTRDFAEAVVRTAAGPVHEALAAAHDGADAGGLADHALAAGAAALEPHGMLLRHAEHVGVDGRHDELGGELLGEALDADAAGHAEHDVGGLDLLGDHVEVLPLALADGGRVLDLHGTAVLLGHDAQLAGEDLGFFLAAGEADGDAGVAACDQDLLLVADEFQNLVEGFAFGGDHSACPSSTVAAADDSAS